MRNRKLKKYIPIFIAIPLIVMLLSGMRIEKAIADRYAVQFKSCGIITINGELWIPRGTLANQIAIYVVPCRSVMNAKTIEKDSAEYHFALMQKLLNRGVPWFTFYSREDSLLYAKSTMFTKASDLQAAIGYIKTWPGMESKKIILVGQSEGGAISAIVASQTKIVDAVVLLSAPGVNGLDFFEYQNSYHDTLVFYGYGQFDDFYKLFLNAVPPIKGKHYNKTLEGLRSFRHDLQDPIRQIIIANENYDTIVQKVRTYIKAKWDQEEDSVKRLHKDFYSYYKHYYRADDLTLPERVALRKWEPAKYFPNVTCPVLAVYGTKDRKVEYKSSIENITRLMAQGGNEDLTVLVLKDHDHYLVLGKKLYRGTEEIRAEVFPVPDSSVMPVVEWIVKQ